MYRFHLGLDLLKGLLGDNAFYGMGADLGPSALITDDCSAERNAVSHVWPKCRLLLCTFHVLKVNSMI